MRNNLEKDSILTCIRKAQSGELMEELSIVETAEQAAQLLREDHRLSIKNERAVAVTLKALEKRLSLAVNQN